MMRVLIVDDHAILRSGLKALLDITLPGKNGLDLLKELKVARPKLPVLVLSAHPEDQFAVRALKAGAEGYMTKESAPEELVKAVRKILAGGRYVSPTLAEKLAMTVGKDSTRTPHETLSDREYEVMCRIASGKTVTEIAGELSLSAKTISTYRARILEKLAVKNSAEIMQYAIRNGLVI